MQAIAAALRHDGGGGEVLVINERDNGELAITLRRDNGELAITLRTLRKSQARVVVLRPNQWSRDNG
jgi:hypothetical protein